jgi:hypothetical protein
VNQPWVGMKVKDDWLVRGEEHLKLPIGLARRVLNIENQPERIDDVTNRTFTPGKYVRRSAMAANDSLVGTSPQLAITTSGSAPWSLLAQSQIPAPIRAVFDRGFHLQILEMGLFVSDDNVHVINAAQAMIGDR